MAEPLKQFLDERVVADLAARLHALDAGFQADTFIAAVAPRLPELELKERSAAIADVLHDFLPPSYPAALRLLLAALDEGEGARLTGWSVWPVATFVERHGLDHPAESLAALHTITQLFTAEFAIRPFLQRYPEQSLRVLHQWARDPSEHVRRLVSEGTRTRLPWATRLPEFIADPSPVLVLLEMLKDDPSPYVRRSVANNLNDLAKDHSDRVLSIARDWQQSASPERQTLIRHALRMLVKQGHPGALALLGAESPRVTLLGLRVTPEAARIGDEILIEAMLRNDDDVPQHLIVDYVLRLAGARDGAPRQKVFKLRATTVPPQSILHLRKRHSLRQLTTRRLYPGAHRIEIQVNGVIVDGVDFTLAL